jgi:hypothetical protein
MTQRQTDSPLRVLEHMAADVPLSELVDTPDWTDCGQTWMAYVPDELRLAWLELPREARLLAVILGNELLDRERWE